MGPISEGIKRYSFGPSFPFFLLFSVVFFCLFLAFCFSFFLFFCSFLHFCIFNVFHFFIFSEEKSLFFSFFLFFFQIFFLLALVSEFNCFLRGRCSMEMWCPDDIGRDSWDWVGPPAWVRACFNSPEWGGGSSPVKTEPLQIVLLWLLLWLLLWFQTHMRVCVCSPHFAHCKLQVQTWRRGRAQTQGIIPPQS